MARKRANKGQTPGAGKRGAAGGRAADAPGRSTDRDRLLAAALGILAVAACAALGATLWFTAPTLLLLGPFAGLLAALAARRASDAALAAAVGSVAGVALAAFVSRAPWDAPSTWLPDALGLSVVAAAVAFAVAYLREREPRITSWLGVAALTLLVVGVWWAGTAVATKPAMDGSTLASVLAAPPKAGTFTSDEDIYLRYVARLRAGEPYYRAAATTLQEANRYHVKGIDVSTPLSFRLPTLYWLLSRLPAGGLPMVYAGLLWASLAAAAAFLLARRFVADAFALVAATAAGAYCANVATNTTLVQTEWWAGVLGLLSLALYLTGRGSRSHRLAWTLAAVAAATAAALVRELAVPFLLLGLAASLLGDEETPAVPRPWLPWAAGLAVVTLAYAAHWVSAEAVIRTLHATPAGGAPWFHPDGRGLVSAVFRIARMLATKTWVAWVVALVAMAGALLAPRDRAARLVLAAAAVAGPALLLFVYPSGVDLSGLAPSYWADVVVPTLLACVPLALALLPDARRTGA
jgi:hypothetical protein